ncbi:phosphoribulokinase [Aurantivibrio plasticivorans]
MGDVNEQAVIRSFIAQEKVPDSFHDTIRQWYLPLVNDLVGKVRSGHLSCIGVSGCQGSGKSTLAGFMSTMLADVHQLRVVSISMDDVYLTRAERQALGSRVHPLLATRGVPGTHDVALALATLNALQQSGEVKIPRFDKSSDDRVAEAQWDRVRAPVDLVIFEGWCLGTPAQPEEALSHPVNPLEQVEDQDGTWRGYVNRCLSDEYAEWFNALQYLIFLKAPNFDAVYRWRGRQEDKLRQKLVEQSVDSKSTKVMDESQLSRFIQHYERLTCHSLQELPSIADVIFELNEEQMIERCLRKQ